MACRQGFSLDPGGQIVPDWVFLYQMQSDRDPSQAIQRVKVALIGLGAVMGLIGLASVIIGSASRERPISAIGAPQPQVVANMAIDNGADSVAEPLVELGVAPSANVQLPEASQ